MLGFTFQLSTLPTLAQWCERRLTDRTEPGEKPWPPEGFQAASSPNHSWIPGLGRLRPPIA